MPAVGFVRRPEMAVLLAVLLIVLLLGGFGFAVHALWWIALILLAVWLVGFFVRGTTAAGARSRWYRW
jgi:lysylphosphatidylglycerol synthetase-like protein (DUF2156 family)